MNEPAAKALDAEPAKKESLTSVAVRGSAWMSVQAALNKLASAVSMYIVSKTLLPPELALGALVVSIVNFLTICPPMVMCDVLVAHQSRLATLLGPGRRIANRVGLGTAVALTVASPFVARFYPEYPATELALLVAALGFRAWANALSTTSLACLRSTLRYKTIVVIDGGTQLGSTTLTLVLALLGAGATSIVLPYLVASIARALAYWIAFRRDVESQLPEAPPPTEGEPTPDRRLRRDFQIASLAQYVHTAVGALPMLVLGRLVSDDEGGAYGFAALLAVQATSIVAYQLGIVLQPVFGRLGHDPERQIAGYVRAIRMLGFVAVPLAVLQAALAEPLFRLLFSPRWDAALPIFQVLCISQCFHFGLAPTLSLIKAQARFKITFAWQITHLAVGVAAMVVAAKVGGAMGVAVANTVLWGVSIPLATWLAGQPGKLRIRTSMRVFLEPWTVGIPVGALLLGVWHLLEPYGTAGEITSLLAGPVVALIASALLIRWLHPDLAASLAAMGPIARLLRRLRLAS